MFFKWNQFFPGSIRLPANINLYDDLEDEDLLDLDEYVEYDDIEDNLGESARYLRQSAGPNTHYVQVTPMEVLDYSMHLLHIHIFQKTQVVLEQTVRKKITP